jgi:hypothetical protein
LCWLFWMRRGKKEIGLIELGREGGEMERFDEERRVTKD